MSRGIFRLKQVYEEQLSGTWSTRGDVWTSPSPFTKAHPFGYFAGGYNSSGELSVADRIDYSNDTATASSLANLSFSAWSVSGTGNANFGYFIGGETFPSPQFSSINRVDYSNDTLTSSVSPLPSARSSVGATGNNNFGYVGGGRTPSNISTEIVLIILMMLLQHHQKVH